MLQEDLRKLEVWEKTWGMKFIKEKLYDIGNYVKTWGGSKVWLGGAPG